MFKNNYYYLVSGLLDISLDINKLAQGLSEFRNQLKNHLPVSDYKFVEMLFLDIDNKNVLNRLQNNKEVFIEGGKYLDEEIEQFVKEPAFDEEYLNRLVKAYLSETPVFQGMLLEDQFSSLYYEYVIASSGNTFLSSYFEFDLNIRNIFTALTARKHNIKDKVTFIGTNTVTLALESPGLRDFGLSGEFPLIERIISVFENNDLTAREKTLDEMRWNHMDELNLFNYFTIEVLLAYLIKLKIIERWLKLDEKEGSEMFGRIIDSLNKSFEFNKEFSIHERRKN
jgi:hypothetical protein